MQKKLLPIVGYGAFALASLFVGLYLTFPAEAVGQRLAHEVHKSSGGSLSLAFEDVSLYRLSGVAAEGVKVRASKEGQQPIEFEIDEVKARLRLLPLLWLSVSLDAELELGEGTIDAVVTPGSGGALSAELAFDEVNLASPPIVPALAGMVVGGKLNGELTIDWQTDPKKSTGKGTLSLAGASIGPGTISGFTFPGVELGTLDVGMTVEKGKLQIASFKQQGGDVQLKMSGGTSLRPELSASTLDACVEFKAEAAFLDKNPKIKTALSLAEVQLKKSPQGYLNVPLSGTFARPRMRGGLCSRSSK